MAVSVTVAVALIGAAAVAGAVVVTVAAVVAVALGKQAGQAGEQADKHVSRPSKKAAKR